MQVQRTNLHYNLKSMDTKVKGIILKLTNIKEADKLASIFSLEQGVISANFRGVRKEKSKMKSSAQPFAFAEFNINQTGNFRVVTGANVIDSFYGLTSNYNKTIMGFIVLDIIKTILPAEKPEPDLFVLSLDALKQIETTDEYQALLNFILQFIQFCGMGLDMSLEKLVYLDRTTGDFVESQGVNTMQIDKKVYSYLKQVAFAQKTDANELTKKQALRLLNTILLIKFNAEIKAFKFI